MKLILSAATFAVMALPMLPSFAADAPFQVARSRDAEEVCVNRAEDRGLRVDDVLSVNDHSGGAEVIMRARQNGNSITIGCDYSSANDSVELYRLESGSRSRSYDDRRSDDSRYYQRSSNDGSVRNEDDAENVARSALGDQLGIRNPYSNVVKIDDIRRETGSWAVFGRANGAAFEMHIRASDATVTRLELH